MAGKLKSDSVSYNDGALVYDNYSHGQKIDDIDMNDGWTPWTSDIKDHSEDTKKELLNVRRDTSAENKRLKEEVEYFKQDAIERIDDKIAGRLKKASDAVIDDLENLKEIVEKSATDMLAYIETDKDLLKTYYENTRKEVDATHNRIVAYNTGDSDGNKQLALDSLDQQVKDLNAYGKKQVIIVNAATDRVREVKEKVDEAISNEDPSMIIPSMLSLMSLQIETPEKPVSKTDAENIYKEQQTIIQTRVAEIENYYEKAKAELQTRNTEFLSDIDTLIQDSKTPEEDKEKYKTIKNQWTKSINAATKEIEDKEAAFSASSTALSQRVLIFDSQIETAKNDELNVFNIAVTSQAQAINAFLREQHHIPKNYISEIRENIVEPYEKALFSKTPPSVLYGIHGVIVAPPLQPIAPTPSAPSDQNDALKKAGDEQTRFNDVNKDTLQRYTDLISATAEKFKDLNAKVDTQLIIHADDEKKVEALNALKTNISESQKALNEEIHNELTAHNESKEKLQDKIDGSLEKINKGLPSNDGYNYFIREINKDVNTLGKIHGRPNAIALNFNSEILNAYNKDLDSIKLGKEVAETKPYSLGEIPDSVPPASTSVSAAVGGAPTASTATSTASTSTSTSTSSTAATASADPAVNEARKEALEVRDGINAQYLALQQDLDALKSTEEFIRKEVMPEAEKQHAETDSQNTAESLRIFKCYHEELQDQIKLLEAAKDNAVWAETSGIIKKINASENVAEINALGAQLKPYATSTKNLAESTKAQTDAFIDEYTDHRVVDYYLGGGMRRDQGLLVVGGGKHGFLYDIFGAGAPNVKSYAGGLYDTAVGTVQSWWNGWEGMKKDAGRYGTKGEQRTLNYLENGVFALAALWAGKHALNFAGVDNKLLRGAVMIGVIGFFLHRTGMTGQKMHDYGKVRSAMQSEGYGRNLPKNVSQLSESDLDKAKQELADATGKSKAEVEEMVNEVQESMENSGEELVQSSKGEIPTGAANDEEPNLVSQGSTNAPKQIAAVNQVVDPATGADAANTDPALNTGLNKAS